MPFLIHPSAHPQLLYAKGDILNRESYARFDGLIIFIGGFNGLTATAKNVLRNGSIPIPYRIHKPKDGQIPENVSEILRHDLGLLFHQGCKRIGIHTWHDMKPAKTSVRSAVRWLNEHPGSVESVTFVDLEDDYYHCFGMDPLKTGQPLFNARPTRFEKYFENGFLEDLDRQFHINWTGTDGPWCVVLKEPVNSDIAGSIDFSVSVFYTVLVPQVLAKVTGKSRYLFAFFRRAKWPAMDRLGGGFMAPYVYLSDTGLLPEGKAIDEWIACAEKECDYFWRVATYYVVNGVQPVRSVDSVRLARITSTELKAVRRELIIQVKMMADFLKGGPGIPNYYLPDIFQTSEAYASK